jgi:hypothetical protein
MFEPSQFAWIAELLAAGGKVDVSVAVLPTGVAGIFVRDVAQPGETRERFWLDGIAAEMALVSYVHPQSKP